MITDRLLWQRIKQEAFIQPQANTIASEAVTTPDVIEMNNELFLYLGAVNNSQEKIILTKINKKDFINKEKIIISDEAKIILEPGPFDFDCKHVFDPAVIHWKNKFWLYYSAIGNGSDKIGVAISDNGVDYKKINQPILSGRSPEVILKDDKVYLFYVKNLPNHGYSVFLDTSEDGRSYFNIESDPVLTIGNHEDWDNFEVTTPRIFKLENNYYMIYAGLNLSNQKDIPKSFGLARSKDLIHWEKYPGNPIFTCGKNGNWDDGAIWFGTPFVVEDSIYLIYEGGRLINIVDKTPALTEVGLAKISREKFRKVMQAW